MRDVIWMRSICRWNNIALTEMQADQLASYVSLLLQFNRHVNLISRRDEENIWERHILHSIALLFKVKLEGEMILDLGTGGGLPGIPLKILSPSVEFTLIDSIEKKIRIVDEIVRKLELPGVKVICSRAEDLPKKTKFRHYFDNVISRAVAPLKDLVAWSEPLLKRNSAALAEKHERSAKQAVGGGTLIAFKGGNLQKELDDAKLESKVKCTEEIPLMFTGSEGLSFTDKKIVLVRF